MKQSWMSCARKAKIVLRSFYALPLAIHMFIRPSWERGMLTICLKMSEPLNEVRWHRNVYAEVKRRFDAIGLTPAESLEQV